MNTLTLVLEIGFATVIFSPLIGLIVESLIIDDCIDPTGWIAEQRLLEIN
jgi:hypothetical protein